MVNQISTSMIIFFVNFFVRTHRQTHTADRLLYVDHKMVDNNPTNYTVIHC